MPVSAVRLFRGLIFGARTCAQACDLSGADVSNGAFVLARLTNANLSQADARGADFSGADLTDALLISARLDAAVFGLVEIRGTEGDAQGRSMPANLTRADLSNANLTGVDLGEAVLSDTNVAGAIMDRH